MNYPGKRTERVDGFGNRFGIESVLREKVKIVCYPQLELKGKRRSSRQIAVF